MCIPVHPSQLPFQGCSGCLRGSVPGTKARTLNCTPVLHRPCHSSATLLPAGEAALFSGCLPGRRAGPSYVGLGSWEASASQPATGTAAAMRRRAAVLLALLLMACSSAPASGQHPWLRRQRQRSEC